MWQLAKHSVLPALQLPPKHARVLCWRAGDAGAAGAAGRCGQPPISAVAVAAFAAQCWCLSGGPQLGSTSHTVRPCLPNPPPTCPTRNHSTQWWLRRLARRGRPHVWRTLSVSALCPAGLGWSTSSCCPTVAAAALRHCRLAPLFAAIGASLAMVSQPGVAGRPAPTSQLQHAPASQQHPRHLYAAPALLPPARYSAGNPFKAQRLVNRHLLPSPLIRHPHCGRNRCRLQHRRPLQARPGRRGQRPRLRAAHLGHRGDRRADCNRPVSGCSSCALASGQLLMKDGCRPLWVA